MVVDPDEPSLEQRPSVSCPSNLPIVFSLPLVQGVTVLDPLTESLHDSEAHAALRESCPHFGEELLVLLPRDLRVVWLAVALRGDGTAKDQ